MTILTMILGVMSLPWQGGGGLAGSLKPYSSLGTGETISSDNDHDHEGHNDHDHHHHLHHHERCDHDYSKVKMYFLINWYLCQGGLAMLGGVHTRTIQNRCF